MINSPRSIKACNRVGVELSELYQLTMEEFINKYPEVNNMDEKIIKYRYDAEEKFRKETIEQIIKERNKIIEKEKRKDKEKEEDNEGYEFNENANMIEKEKKNIERIKRKQKLDIENMI